MSVERAVAIVAMPDEDRLLLISDIGSAAARAEKALAGDRADIVRYEALSAQLEHWAFARREDPESLVVELPAGTAAPALLVGEAPDTGFLPPAAREPALALLAAGAVLTTIRMPLEIGTATSLGEAQAQPPPPAKPWSSPSGARGAHAVRERFEAQIEACLAGSGAALSPSDIQNTVLTATLRDYVTLPGERVDVPVEYRDGSRSRHPFPLRSLTLIDRLGREPNELKLALLSIRHTEMDAVVDGAFLRNAEISLPRAAAETDDLVYEISREQLLALTDDGRTRLHLRLYQTGLDTAIVGFYRAVVTHLLEHPSSLAVTPMFFESERSGKRRRNAPVDSARFREAAVWATR